MKKKLTLTVEEKLIRKGKVLTAKKGISLSKLLEDTILSLTENNSQSFSDRWSKLFYQKNLTLDKTAIDKARLGHIQGKHLAKR